MGRHLFFLDRACIEVTVMEKLWREDGMIVLREISEKLYLGRKQLRFLLLIKDGEAESLGRKKDRKNQGPSMVSDTLQHNSVDDSSV